MNLLNYIAGFSPAAINSDKLVFNRTLEALQVRVAHSHRVLPLVAIIGLMMVYGLWDQAPQFTLVLWFFLALLFVIARTLVCRHIERNLGNASPPLLYKFELQLFLVSLLSALAVGAGYWLVCLQGTDRAVFAITLFCCIYAIGTTIYTSMQYHSFLLILLANLGQGILYLSVFKSPVDIEIAVSIIGVTLFLARFGQQNSALFSESIRMREENREQNLKLNEDKEMINKALEAAQSAIAQKNQFLATASHDLRQPLHAMTLFLSSLRYNVSTDLAIELIDKLDESAESLRDQFNSLLDLSKFDSGVVAAESNAFRLDTLLQKIVDGLAPDAEKKRLKLSFTAKPVTIHSDALLLERLLRNLVVNAVNYTAEGSVSIATEQNAEGLRIAICDTGPGIPLHEQQHIFDDYYQVKNNARTRHKGSGLGLAIARRISELLGLRINLVSEAGKGSTFEVLIPPGKLREDRVDVRQLVTTTPQRSLQGANILIVDDDPMVLDALAILLRQWGCNSLLADNSAAVNAILAQSPQLDFAIIDDMLEEDMTGLDVARLLEPFTGRNRILLNTGNPNPKRLEEIRDSGFNVMLKPVDQFRLHQIIVAGLNKVAN